MREYRVALIGLFVVWTVLATTWYTFIHQQLGFANNSEIIDNNILEILIIISISFLLGYLIHKAICESKHLKSEDNKVEVDRSSKKDDLKVIEGIGPAIEKLLNKEGIHTYWKLADTPVETLTAWMTKAGPLYLNHGESTWGEQATLLRDGKMAEFEKFTEKLIGGNRVS